MLQFHPTAPWMCPFSYAVVSSSTSMTRIEGSSRCPSSHSVSTSASGFAYWAMTPSLDSDGFSRNHPAHGLADATPPGTLEEPERGLGFLGHHFGRPGRAQA